jgi:hypothetical protein
MSESDLDMVPDSAESTKSTGTTPLFTNMTISKPPLKIKLPNPYFGQTEYIKATSPPQYFKSSKDKGKGRDTAYSSAHIPPTDNDPNNNQRRSHQLPGPSRPRSQSPPNVYDRRNDHDRFPPRRERNATTIIKNDEYATRADRTLKQFKTILPPFLNLHTATTILKDKFRNLENLKIII